MHKNITEISTPGKIGPWFSSFYEFDLKISAGEGGGTGTDSEKIFSTYVKSFSLVEQSDLTVFQVRNL